MYIQKLILFTLLIHSSLFAWENYGGDYFFNLNVNKNFTELENRNVYGDFVATGDSILFVDDGSTPNLITSHTSYKMDMNISQFSSASDERRRNSSTSVLNLPSYVQGSDIVWAGLFWQGHINERGTPLDNDGVDANVSGYDTITIVSQDGTIDDTLVSSKTYYTASRDEDDFRYFYGAYVDVTTFVSTNYSSVNNEFTVGNIMTTAGEDNGSPLYINNSQTVPKLFLDDTAQFGYYGGWSLIVIYNITDTQTVTDNDVKLKNVTIFDGYDLFLTWGEDTVTFDENITLSGFYTPMDGNISSKLLLFGGGGDKNLTPDILQFLDTNSTFVDLSNGPNTAGNQFNHTYTNLGLDMDTNSTTATNKQGMDLDIYDISDYMSNGQSSATIRFGTEKTGAGFSGSSDQLFPQVIGFSTELFQPTFCYDYAYQQSGKYFTEDYNKTSSPSLVGENIFTGSTYPIGMSIFIRNTVNSDINVTDLNVSITDINASQVSYITGTTQIARNSSLIKTPVAAGLTDIPIGTVSSNEYIYIYYDLEANQVELDTPIKVTLDYLVTIDGTDVTYSSQIPSTDIPLCSQGSSSYDVTSGIFNVVHNNYYNLDVVGGTDAYYNLPTQVTKREGNFKVISLADDDDFNTLSPRNTIVAIDMIDVSAFQSTFASCNELTTSITDDKVWVTFDGNDSLPFDQAALQSAIASGMTSLSTSSQFYKTARRNTAFRVTYNIGNDSNQSIINTSLDVSGYTITNAANFAFSDAACNASGLTKLQLKACADDIYGTNTKAVCSRDNFAIRPEAFLIKLNDQDQNNNALQSRLSDQVSGLASPVETITHMAAGYEYNMEATATDHLGNTESYGYTKVFNSYKDPTKNIAAYFWEPRNGRDVSGCNDINPYKLTPVYFRNGAFEDNTSISEVGDYRLNITDTSWTIVDNNIEYMTHHIAPYFGIDAITSSATTDCTLDTGITQSINSASLNGCNISSTHVNNDASLSYNDYNITSHPYQFDLNSSSPITLTTGLNNDLPIASSYIYMSDISSDENMSVHLNGRIKAIGYNATGSELSNFVNQCYAEPLEVRITKSNLTLPIAYQYKFHSLENNGTDLRTVQGDLNTSASVIDLLSSDFPKDLHGRMSTILNLNFSREVNTPYNPQEITFTQYDVNCSILANCAFNADLLTNKTASGSKDLNTTIVKHYYGRTHSPRQRFSTPQGTIALPANELIYYEVYCNGNTCGKTLLQNGLDSNSTDDPRWFINTNHTSGYGTINLITQKGSSINVGVSSTPTGNHPDSVGLVYNASRGYPYKTTMEANASSWLIYNKYNSSATRNEFEVEFLDSNTSWAGNRENTTTTNKTASDKTNRRTMW